MDRIALAIVTFGALNWLLVGLFNYDIIAGILGGQTSFLCRTAYTIIGIAGIWSMSLLFRKAESKT